MTKINGRIVENDGITKATIEFDNGKITKIHDAQNCPQYIDVMYSDDFLIFPGFIDIHTHCREDVTGKDNYKEDFSTAGMAALNGGVICIADMPNNPVAPIDKAKYEAKLALTKKSLIPILPYVGIGPNTVPFTNDLPYKVFMGPSTRSEDELFFPDNASLERTLARYSGCSISFHCEDIDLLTQYKVETLHENKRPPICEVEAVKFALELIDKHQLRGKICHISTAAGLDLIKQARKSSVDVVVEVTPHHLYFDTNCLTPEQRPFLQMNPPLRSLENRQQLLADFKDGEIDFLATDHAPHTPIEKTNGVSGVPQLDTYGPFVAWLISQKIDPVTIFRAACVYPGEWVKQFMDVKIGRLLPGYESSITVLNLKTTAADMRPLYSRCGWSPFDLRKLPGAVQAVYLKGEKVVDGQFIKIR